MEIPASTTASGSTVSDGSAVPIGQGNNINNEDVYEYNDEILLGDGASAWVHPGTLKVAVKKIKLIDLEKNCKTREEDSMRKMNHENVLKLLYNKDEAYYKILVLELCIGTVRNYIDGDEKFIDKMPSETEALLQMANGVAHIHSKHIVHRDIKPENVLISFSYVLKIADFGSSKPTDPTGEFSTKKGSYGTPTYNAPECLLLEDEKPTPEEKKKIRANKSIDIFSLGCLFFSYIIRKGPYTHLFATPKKQYNSNEKFTSDVTNTQNNSEEVSTSEEREKKKNEEKEEEEKKGKAFKKDVTNNIRSDRILEDNGLSSGHYAFEMIDGMTNADPQNRWGLSERNSNSSQSVLDILKKENEKKE